MRPGGNGCPVFFYKQTMATTVECLITSVGLANCACPCDEETAPEGWNDSLSGLFIADLVPLASIGSADDCTSPGNPWTALAKFRTQAATTFRSDLAAVLSKRNKETRATYKGGIGETASRDVVSLSKNYAGLRIHCAHVPHGMFLLEKIGGVFNANGTVLVYVYDRYNELLAGEYQIDTVAGRHSEVTLDPPIELPTYTQFGEAAEYFLVYEKNASNLPRANRTMCPTCKGVSDVFSVGETWPVYPAGIPAWANWLMLGGFQSDDLESFDIVAAEQSATSETNGLTITVSLQCDKTRFICTDTWDANNPLQVVAAHAIYYYAASLAIGAKLTALGVDRGTIANRDEWKEKKEAYLKQYYDRLEYLGEAAKPYDAGCLECKLPVSIRTSGVLS